MTKGKAIALGIFSIWPFVYMFIFMGFFFLTIVTTFMSTNSPGNDPPIMLKLIFPLHFFTMFEIFVLLVIYMVFLFKTDVVPKDKKALWAVVLFMGNMISMPIFWYIYIWKNINGNAQG